MRAAKVQASLCIRAVSPEPSLLAHISSKSRGTFRQKARSLAPLNGWASQLKFVMTECSKTQIRLTGPKCGIKTSMVWLFFSSFWILKDFEYKPPLHKTYKMTCAQQRLRSAWASTWIWSGFSLPAWRTLGTLATHWAPSKDSDAQANLSLCWAYMSFCWFWHAQAHI